VAKLSDERICKGREFQLLVEDTHGVTEEHQEDDN